MNKLTKNPIFLAIAPTVILFAISLLCGWYGSEIEKSDHERQTSSVDRRTQVYAINHPTEAPTQYSPYTSSCPQGCRTPPPNCNIKGNISVGSNEKIYHVPGQKYYSDTTISPDYSERWFCTEQEAQSNGWRKSKE